MTVSVVVTCFNYGRYLRACLDSVLAQTYRDFDVIVVDDGSTDDTVEVVRPYLSDSRLRYHFQENQGHARAKNAGVALTKGDIVAFVDADDVWRPEKLAAQLPLFANPRVGVTYTGEAVMDAAGSILLRQHPLGYRTPRRGQVTTWLAFENFVPFSSVAVRRSLLSQYGVFDAEAIRMGTDWDLWLRLSVVTDFDFVPQELVVYRVHGNQISSDATGRIAASEFIFKRFLTMHPHAIRPHDLNAIEYYNAWQRAAAYRPTNLRRSTAYYVKAAARRPWAPKPYLGIAKNAALALRKLVRPSSPV